MRGQVNVDLAADDRRITGAMKLHRANAVTDLECQPRRLVERDVIGNLSDDGGELPSLHMRPLAFVHIP